MQKIPIFGFVMVTVWVIALLVAAGAVALIGRPATTQPRSARFLAGELIQAYDEGEDAISQQLAVYVDDEGVVRLTRILPPGFMSASGAVSLAVSVQGDNVTIVERDVFSSTPSDGVNRALFSIDFLGRAHYQVLYKIEEHVAAAFSLNVSPGRRMVIDLSV